MDTARFDPLVDILQAHFHPREEGWLWLLMPALDGGQGVAASIEDAMAHMDDLMMRNLAWILGESPADLLVVNEDTCWSAHQEQRGHGSAA